MGRLKVSRAVLTGAGFDLQLLPVSAAAGNVDVPVPGIKRGDELLLVLRTDFTDETPGASIPEDGIVRLGAATDGVRLLVIWYSV